jgi:hypothetical protein
MKIKSERLYVRVSLLLLSLLGLSINLSAQNHKPVTEQEIQALIDKLNTQPWEGVVSLELPGKAMESQFTEPMKEIIRIGNPAQSTLLKNLSNPKLKIEMILLLGGVGDEASVKPLIDEFIGLGDPQPGMSREVMFRNICIKVALTNITAADLAAPTAIGTFYGERCPTKACWEKWWEANKSTFSAKDVGKKRDQFFVPNYGIYSQSKQ